MSNVIIPYNKWIHDKYLTKRVVETVKDQIRVRYPPNINELFELTELLTSEKRKKKKADEKDNTGYFWICRNLFTYGNCLCPKDLLKQYKLEDIMDVLSLILGKKVTFEVYIANKFVGNNGFRYTELIKDETDTILKI